MCGVGGGDREVKFKTFLSLSLFLNVPFFFVLFLFVELNVLLYLVTVHYSLHIEDFRNAK